MHIVLPGGWTLERWEIKTLRGLFVCSSCIMLAQHIEERVRYNKKHNPKKHQTKQNKSQHNKNYIEFANHFPFLYVCFLLWWVPNTSKHR